MNIAHTIQSIDFLTEFSESVLAYPIVLADSSDLHRPLRRHDPHDEPAPSRAHVQEPDDHGAGNQLTSLETSGRHRYDLHGPAFSNL